MAERPAKKTQPRATRPADAKRAERRGKGARTGHASLKPAVLFDRGTTDAATSPLGEGSPLPDEWRTIGFGALQDRGLVAIQNGFPCGRHNQEGRGTPHLRPFNVTANGTISLEKIIYCEPEHDVSRYFINEGDVIFNNTNSEELVGKTAFWSRRDGNFVPSNHMTVVRVLSEEGPDAAWLALQLHKLYWDGVFQALCRRHVNQASVSVARLRTVRLLFPPLIEQRAIAAVLTTIRRAIEATDRVIAAMRELKKSLMRHLFTYGPVPIDQADQVPLKETEIGPMPEHWQLRKLGDVADIGNGSTPSRSNVSYWTDGRIPWLTSGKVHEVVIRRADQFVTEVARRECHLPVVKAGSIVVAITGQGKTLGNAALITFDTCVNQHLAYVQLKNGAPLASFVRAYLQTRYDHFREVSGSGGSTKGALTCAFLRRYPLPYPPQHDQRKISTALDAAHRKLETEQARKSALEALFTTVLRLLMTGRVRVSDCPEEAVPTAQRSVAPATGRRVHG